MTFYDYVMQYIKEYDHTLNAEKTIIRYCFYIKKICEELGNKVLLSTVLYNISSIYYEQGNFDIALKHLNDSLSISRDIGDIENIDITLSTIESIKRTIR